MPDLTGSRTFSHNSQAQPETESIDSGWLDLDLVRNYETGSSGSGAPVEPAGATN